MKIDRCYCFVQTFATLKKIAGETNSCSVGELRNHVAFGDRCGLCHPYIKRMLRTGETVFGSIIHDRDVEVSDTE